jgi:Cu/Ag efflux pump CusA
MPPLNEARQVLQVQDRLLKRFPEVETVFGKIGRSNSPTDPAPLNMVKTVVTLKPPEEWRKVPVERGYSSWAPAWLKPPLNGLWPEERSVTWEKTLIVFLAVPFSLVGAVWLLYLLDYHLSVAVWVGLIALAGLDAETGVVMLPYLDLAYEQMKREGRMKSFIDLKEAVMQGAVKRIQPKMMTVTVILVGLLPILWGHGTGADVMKRIAAPMIGGVITSAILELLIYPAIYSGSRMDHIQNPTCLKKPLASVGERVCRA